MKSKQCPGCYAFFGTHFALFQHRVEECKSDRDITIVKVESKLAQKLIGLKPIKKPNRFSAKDIVAHSSNPVCNDCEETFSSFHALNQHKRFDCELNPVRKVSRPKTFYRCQCGTRFSTSSNLRRHKTSGSCSRIQKKNPTNLNVKGFYCVECKSEYSTISNLRRHKLTQCPFGKEVTVLPSMVPRRVACPDCGVTFSRSGNLSRHRKNVRCWDKTQEDNSSE